MPYQWHLANRNKRSITLDLKSPSAQQVLFELANWADVFIVNTPHHARKKLKLEYDDVAGWNPRLIYADLTGFGENGPDANLPGFDITSYWARSGLLSMTRDAGAPPTWPVSGSGDNATAVGLYSAIVTALYRRERTGKGSYVTTSLLAEGVWSASVSIQAALAGAKFPPLHDRTHPANAAMNVYRAADGTWFVLIVTPDKFAAVAKAIGRADLLTDPRFSDPAQLVANMPQLTAIFDEVFGAQAMAHWHSVFAGVNVTFGEVRGPQEVINDPQLTANEIVVPLEGAGGKLTSTISSPIQVHGVAKVPARRAPGLGEHTEEILGELGFDARSIESLRESGAVPKAKEHAALAAQIRRNKEANDERHHHRAYRRHPAGRIESPGEEERDDRRHVHAASPISSARPTRTRQIRVVLWHGAGDAFCAGNDIGDFLKTSRARRNPAGPPDGCVHQVRKADRRGRARRGDRWRHHDADALRFRLRGREREVQAAVHRSGTGAGVRIELFDTGACRPSPGGGIVPAGGALRRRAGGRTRPGDPRGA